MHRYALVTLIVPFLLLVPRPATASVYGEENILLGEIASTVAEQLVKAEEVIGTIDKYVGMFEKYANYTKQAYETFAAVKDFNLDTLTAQSFFEQAFPDAAAVQFNTNNGDWWQSSGGTQPRQKIHFCFKVKTGKDGTSSKQVCSDVLEVDSVDQIRSNLAATFGPGLSGGSKALLDTAATTIKTAQEAINSSQLEKDTQANKLLESCLESNDPSGCALASDIAGMLQTRQLADIKSILARIAEQNALAATHELEREQRERDQQEAQRLLLQQAVYESSGLPAPKPPPKKTSNTSSNTNGNSTINQSPSK